MQVVCCCMLLCMRRCSLCNRVAAACCGVQDVPATSVSIQPSAAGRTGDDKQAQVSKRRPGGVAKATANLVEGDDEGMGGIDEQLVVRLPRDTHLLHFRHLPRACNTTNISKVSTHASPRSLACSAAEMGTPKLRQTASRHTNRAGRPRAILVVNMAADEAPHPRQSDTIS